MLVASNFELVVGEFDYNYPPCIKFDSQGSLEWIDLANAITSNINYLNWSLYILNLFLFIKYK